MLEVCQHIVDVVPIVDASHQCREDRIAQDALYTLLDLPSCGIICDNNCMTENQIELAIQVSPTSLLYLISDSLHARAQVNVTLFTCAETNAGRPLLPLLCILMKLLDLRLPIEASCTFCME